MFLIYLKHWSVQNLSCRLRGSVYKFVMSYQSIESSRAETGSQYILSLIKMYKVLIDNKKDTNENRVTLYGPTNTDS